MIRTSLHPERGRDAQNHEEDDEREERRRRRGALLVRQRDDHEHQDGRAEDLREERGDVGEVVDLRAATNE